MITLPESQIYTFFLDNGPGAEGTFLFRVKLDPNLRPKVGDSVTLGPEARDFRIMRDEIPITSQVFTRVTEDNMIRITEDDDTRILEGAVSEEDPFNSTHNYFVTPANNPNRISSWTRTDFANDQTLRQLFR